MNSSKVINSANDDEHSGSGDDNNEDIESPVDEVEVDKETSQA